MRPVIVIALCGLLMGCQTEREAAIRAQDDAKCQSFGAPKGSKAYYDCRMALEHDRAQIAASQGFGQGFGREGVLTRLLRQN